MTQDIKDAICDLANVPMTDALEIKFYFIRYTVGKYLRQKFIFTWKVMLLLESRRRMKTQNWKCQVQRTLDLRV